MLRDLTLSDVFNRETPFESLVPGTGIVLIGRSSRGPAMVPIKTVDADQVNSIFGSDSELSGAYIEAKMHGATELYLMRINGTHAETNIQGYIKLISLEANSTANDLQYMVSFVGDEMYLQVMNSTTGYSITYLLTGKDFSQIVSEINTDAIVLGSPVYALLLQDGYPEDLIEEYPSRAQTNGADTSSMEPGSLERLKEALEYLDAYPIAQVGILQESFYKVYDGEFVYQVLSDFAMRKSRSCNPCIVTVGTEIYSVVSGEDIFTIASAFTGVMEIECQVSEFVNVVIAKPVFPILGSNYASNGVASYCGLIDGTGYAESTTNKVIVGATNDTSKLTDNQKQQLSSLGYVVFKEGTFGGEKQVRVYRGVNLAKGSGRVVDLDEIQTVQRTIPSQLSNVGNVKLIQHLVYKLNDVLNQEEIAPISTLRSRIVEVLDEEPEYVRSYTIDIAESYEGYAKTYILDVQLVLAGELGSLTLSMQTQ